MLDLRIFTFLFHIWGGYEPAPVVWVVAVLVGVWLFVAGPFWFWLVSSHPTLNSFKVTCASRHTQRPYPCKKDLIKRDLVEDLPNICNTLAFALANLFAFLSEGVRKFGRK